jgi:putative tricarboxylic transport membrane protein
VEIELKRLPRDFWVGVVMLSLALAYWLGADSIPISPLDGAVNASALPKMLATALAVLAALLMVKSLAAVDWKSATASHQESQGESSPSAQWSNHLRALGLVGIGAIYVVALNYIGYFICIALLVIAVARYTGEPLSGRLLMLGLGLAVLFQLFFVQLLHIQLPAGIFAGLKLF